MFRLKSSHSIKDLIKSKGVLALKKQAGRFILSFSLTFLLLSTLFMGQYLLQILPFSGAEAANDTKTDVPYEPTRRDPMRLLFLIEKEGALGNGFLLTLNAVTREITVAALPPSHVLADKSCGDIFAACGEVGLKQVVDSQVAPTDFMVAIDVKALPNLLSATGDLDLASFPEATEKTGQNYLSPEQLTLALDGENEDFSPPALLAHYLNSNLDRLKEKNLSKVYQSIFNASICDFSIIDLKEYSDFLLYFTGKEEVCKVAPLP